MAYDITKFRSIRHGVKEITAYCRQCNFSLDSCKDKDVADKARDHSRKTLHTVDVYRENHTELTCFVKEIPANHNQSETN